ncbi:hypothetical protein A2210_00325 [Candidatus Woesebacteria bacterium RIFOXYA1_FULL_40_18]|uniref:Uncharacterized protein n=5 Tax=Candidatus Woeseibacteriota TaxID=1752722 RepID=A0A0G0SEY0_9BACT|nr:MAG: hypothetical protein UT72_C0030G0008 [Candidatus Woesebacteria bacterium GW2011_GWB1_40_101]KKR63518.1 MAG: hypothetical protein UU03_C0003G0025 [Candidatus Woesebacteria bacterium GW2011_GWA1_40_45]OGM75529.1 MAG: hypothetical protein A2210_00325 [Candidatus Woesebacteria bacterium RIFOXYA1_FULL_40_18]OGM81493.1 MAG: hypothetical protein A2361_02385 [Candidatus Woesebacteria bacterium RIFOXYB1_FULL_40_26]OGM86990.1 MAG: hypothetical protein A2614_01765 [Candidatus Woesebacteria bacteri
MPRNKSFTPISAVLKKYKLDDTDKYISREFQKYGYDLAQELGDPEGVSLYIKLAKETPRGFLESARSFVKDAYNVKSKPRLFMWKLAELKRRRADTQEERRR